MFIYICIHTYIYTYIYICIDMYTYIYIQKCIHVYLSMSEVTQVWMFAVSFSRLCRYDSCVSCMCLSVCLCVCVCASLCVWVFQTNKRVTRHNFWLYLLLLRPILIYNAHTTYNSKWNSTYDQTILMYNNIHNMGWLRSVGSIKLQVSLQNIVSFLGLFRKRDLYFDRSH